MEISDVEIQNLSLRATIERYATPGATFSFVSATDEKNQQIVTFLKMHYEGTPFSLCDDKINLFDNLAIVDNIYIENVHTFGRQRRAQIDRCQHLLNRVGFDISPMTLVKRLTREEKWLVALLREYERRSSVIALCNAPAFIGYRYYEVFAKVVDLFIKRNNTVILLTSRWEDTLKFSQHIAVMTNYDQYTVMPIEEVIKNPRKIIFVLAGDEDNDGSNDVRRNMEVLATIFKGSELFMQNKEFSDALRFLSASIRSTMSAQSCVIYFQSDDGHIFHYYDEKQQGAEYLLKEEYVMKGIHGTEDVIFLSKRSCNISDLFCAPPKDTRILFSLPIVIAPARIGLMAVTFDHYFVYTEEQLGILRAFCHEVARIIQTSQIINHSILLQESYHRIKNNLQMIVSLIYTQKAAFSRQSRLSFSEEDVALVLDDIIGQIKSIACVHELMAGDSLGSNIINLEYVVDKIVKIYSPSKVDIRTRVGTVAVLCNKAVSIAMIVNELVCNCVRHAFWQECPDPRVEVAITKTDNEIRLCVEDNGVGIDDPDGFLNAESVGATIIRNILRELRGTCSIECQNGTRITIDIPKSSLIKELLYETNQK